MNQIGLGLCFMALAVVGCGREREPASTGPSAAPSWIGSDAQTPAAADKAGEAALRDLALAAQSAERAGDMAGCIRNEQASLTLHESARVRLRLASCQSRTGQLVAAYANTSSAREVARYARDAETEKIAAARATELEARMATIEVELDAATSATVDGDPIASRQKSLLDPGTHELSVTFGGSTLKKTLKLVEHESVDLVADAKAQTVEKAPPRPAKRDPLSPVLY